MSIVEIPVDDLLKILPFVAEQDVRYYLNGVFVTPYEGGALLVATDGHRLAVCESKEARTDMDHILDVPPDFAEILREHRSKTLSVESATAHIVVHANGFEYAAKPGKPFIDGKYPEWRKVLPKPSDLEPGLIGALSPRYFASLRDVMPENSRTSLMFWHRKDSPAEHASIFRFDGHPELLIAIMPMRANYPTTWPAWMPHQDEPAAGVAA